MAEFTVSPAEMSNASGKYKNQAEAFRSTANALLQATTDLTSTGWDDEASKVFAEKISELKSWCDSMGAIIDTFAGALNTISDKYIESDGYAASQFKGC